MNIFHILSVQLFFDFRITFAGLQFYEKQNEPLHLNIQYNVGRFKGGDTFNTLKNVQMGFSIKCS